MCPTGAGGCSGVTQGEGQASCWHFQLHWGDPVQWSDGCHVCLSSPALAKWRCCCCRGNWLTCCTRSPLTNICSCERRGWLHWFCGIGQSVDVNCSVACASVRGYASEYGPTVFVGAIWFISLWSDCSRFVPSFLLITGRHVGKRSTLTPQTTLLTSLPWATSAIQASTKIKILAWPSGNLHFSCPCL